MAQALVPVSPPLYTHVLYSITEFFLVSQRLSSLWSGAKEYRG